MSDSFVQVPPDSTGKQIATNEIDGKQYQVVQIADASGADILAAVQELSASINTLVQFMYANMPRVDATKRLVTNGTETTQGVSGTVTANVATAGGFALNNERFMQVPLWIYNNINTSGTTELAL